MRISDWSSTCALPICASMKVIYHPEDMQERFALKDYFRSRYGYKLGRKVAWFSGKSLLRPTDLASGRVWRDDHINKIRFFRSEERRVGKEGVLTFRSRWLPVH